MFSTCFVLWLLSSTMSVEKEDLFSVIFKNVHLLQKPFTAALSKVWIGPTLGHEFTNMCRKTP